MIKVLLIFSLKKNYIGREDSFMRQISYLKIVKFKVDTSNNNEINLINLNSTLNKVQIVMFSIFNK